MTWVRGDLAMVAKPFQLGDRELLHERLYVEAESTGRPGYIVGRMDSLAGTKEGGAYGVITLPAEVLKTDPTPFGFQWGPVEVIRMAEHHVPDTTRHWRIVQIQTDAGVSIQVYVSGTGRSVRVYRERKGKRAIELVPGPEPK